MTAVCPRLLPRTCYLPVTRKTQQLRVKPTSEIKFSCPCEALNRSTIQSFERKMQKDHFYSSSLQVNQVIALNLQNHNKFTSCNCRCAAVPTWCLCTHRLIFDRLPCSNSGAAYSCSPVCLEDVRLCLEAEEQTLQGKKSSSLTNINQRGNVAANRRRSLPGTPTRGRQKLSRH